MKGLWGFESWHRLWCVDHVLWWSQPSYWTDDGHVPTGQEELTATRVRSPSLPLVFHEQESLLIGWLCQWLWLTCSGHHYARKHTELSSWLQQLPLTVTCQWHWFYNTQIIIEVYSIKEFEIEQIDKFCLFLIFLCSYLKLHQDDNVGNTKRQ